MVGAVGLTLKRPVSVPNQDVFAQHYVDFQKVVVQIPGASIYSFFGSSTFSTCHRTLFQLLIECDSILHKFYLFFFF